MKFHRVINRKIRCGWGATGRPRSIAPVAMRGLQSVRFGFALVAVDAENQMRGGNFRLWPIADLTALTRSCQNLQSESPGGPAEVSRILGGKDITGCDVLDIGSGTGGVDIALVRDHGAGTVIGVDVEKRLVYRGWQLQRPGG